MIQLSCRVVLYFSKCIISFDIYDNLKAKYYLHYTKKLKVGGDVYPILGVLTQ